MHKCINNWKSTEQRWNNGFVLKSLKFYTFFNQKKSALNLNLSKNWTQNTIGRKWFQWKNAVLKYSWKKCLADIWDILKSQIHMC